MLSLPLHASQEKHTKPCLPPTRGGATFGRVSLAPRWLRPSPVLLTVASLLAAPATWPRRAEAERTHVVRPGQTISAIARRYRVPVSAVLGANRLSSHATIRPGQELLIPEPGVIYVRAGDTLSRLARKYQVSIQELRRVNRLRSSRIREGQRLLLPGHEPADRARRAARRWGRPRHPGLVTLLRIYPKKLRRRVRLLDRRGRPRKTARKVLMRFMRHRSTGKVKPPHPRLLRVLTRISDHFGGRPIVVVSGYRPAGGYTRSTSRHTKGRAIDIRIPGVPNKVLFTYCRTLGDIGCGFYPRSTFVHVDVREHPAAWYDWSRPGERPIYTRPGERPGGRRTPTARARTAQREAPSPPTAPSPPSAQATGSEGASSQ